MGGSHLLLWTFLLSIFIFVFSLIMSVLYRMLFGRVVDKLCDWMYASLRKVLTRFETAVMSLK